MLLIHLFSTLQPPGDSHRLLDSAIGSRMSDSSAAEMGIAGVGSVLPPSYVDFKELIRAEMVGVKAKMGQLRKLHGQVCCDAVHRGRSQVVPLEIMSRRFGCTGYIDQSSNHAVECCRIIKQLSITNTLYV